MFVCYVIMLTAIYYSVRVPLSLLVRFAASVCAVLHMPWLFAFPKQEHVFFCYLYVFLDI